MILTTKSSPQKMSEPEFAERVLSGRSKMF